MEPLWVIGAGGHAKVVIATLRAAGDFEIAGVSTTIPVLGRTAPRRRDRG